MLRTARPKRLDAVLRLTTHVPLRDLAPVVGKAQQVKRTRVIVRR